MNADMRAEHIYNTMVESKYLIDTRRNRLDDLCAGFQSEDIIKMLLLGGDLVGFRKMMDDLICGDKEFSGDYQNSDMLGHGSSSGYDDMSSRMKEMK